MATSKNLQKPTIIGIVGSTIKISHPDISKNAKSYLAAPISAAGTAMTVLDNNGFSDNDWFIVGEIGNQETEENDVNGAVTRGNSITVTNTLKFDHEIPAPVNKIYERGIKIYGAATDGGAGTLIESLDAITVPVADAVSIQWNRNYTEYTLLSTDTAYAYYYVVFSDGTTSSDPSDYILAAGLSSSSVMYMIQQALDLTNSELDDKGITLPQCIRWADNAQSEITQYIYKDPGTARYNQQDWSFEVSEDITTLSISENENTYSIAGLSMKYAHDKSIISIAIGAEGPLKKITTQDMDELLKNSPRTDLAVEANAGDVSITVDSNVLLEDSGSLYLGADRITYTGKTGTTILTGIPASGDGAITETHAVDSPVWQNAAPGVPTKYAIFNGNLILNAPPEDSLDGYPIKIKFMKKLPALTQASDSTEVTFPHIFQNYIASKIELRKGNADSASTYKQDFDNDILKNVIANSVPTTDYYRYYNFVQ